MVSILIGKFVDDLAILNIDYVTIINDYFKLYLDINYTISIKELNLLEYKVLSLLDFHIKI